jgi:hypothetical protein
MSASREDERAVLGRARGSFHGLPLPKAGPDLGEQVGGLLHPGVGGGGHDGGPVGRAAVDDRRRPAACFTSWRRTDCPMALDGGRLVLAGRYRG